MFAKDANRYAVSGERSLTLLPGLLAPVTFLPQRRQRRPTYIKAVSRNVAMATRLQVAEAEITA